MPKKATSAPTGEPSNPAELKPEVLNILLDLMDEIPPLGAHYELLLKDLIVKAFEQANGYLEPADKKRFLEDIFRTVTRLGPIEPYLNDAEVSEIMVNGPSQVYIEKNGKVILTDVKYDDDRQVRFAINHILNPLGRFANFKQPMVDSHLSDGSRVNVVIPPIAQQGSCISIRKFLRDMLSDQDLLRLNSMSEAMAEFLAICVKARLNIVVAGNTSSGKTTLLNILAKNIPDTDRIITVEDSVELQLVQTHKISLEARPSDYKGEGRITIRDLVRNTLRMRPDRIIVGEVRGGEALDMLQAMNTGHDGSMTTIHSNSPRDTLARLETTTLMAGIELPVSAIRKQIASALDLIVYLTRFPDGTRKITQITEVVGMEGEVITLTDIFVFQQIGVDDQGRPKGNFKATGLRPMFSPKLEAIGYKLEQHLFRNN